MKPNIKQFVHSTLYSHDNVIADESKYQLVQKFLDLYLKNDPDYFDDLSVEYIEERFEFFLENTY